MSGPNPRESSGPTRTETPSGEPAPVMNMRLARMRRQSVPRIDGVRAPPLHRRFQTRVFLNILMLSLVTAVASAGIYYWQQLRFIEKNRTRHARTVVTSLATEAELGAYASDAALCTMPADRVLNGEEDVVFVAIYDRRGRAILLLAGGDQAAPPPDPVIMRRMLTNPDALPDGIRVHGEGRAQIDFDDLYATIATRVRDPAESIHIGRSGGPPVKRQVVGVARVGLSRRLEREQLAEIIRVGGFLAAGLLVLGLFAALLVSRHVSRPIAALTRGAERIRAGHLDTRVTIQSGDELGQLGYSFNRMAARLAETMTALETLNRDLETEVAQRTLAIQRAASFTTLLNAPLGQKTAGSGLNLPRGTRDNANGPLAQLLDAALCALIEGTGATGAAALLSREEAVDFDLAAAWCIGVAEDNLGPLPSESALTHGGPWYEQGTAPPGPLDDAPRDRLMLPLVLGSEPTGCIVLLCAGRPGDDEVQFAAHAASQLAIAVGNMRAYAAQLHLARELQARNAALALQRDKLQEMNRLKSEFLANTSHELRTPLNAIIGYAEMIADGIYGEVNEDQKMALTGIDESSRNLLALINNILDLAKVESGKMTVHEEEVDLVELLHGVVVESAPLTKEKPYEVRLEAPPRLRIRTDGAKVKQIVTNLVSNAIKFTAEGEVAVTVRAEAHGGCTIAVRDTGIGIRPEDQKIIFEEFRQLDGSYTRTYGGTGLGLAIARRLTELLGGNISVESTLGQGATFTLRLPGQLPVAPSPRRHTLPPPLPPEIVHR